MDIVLPGNRECTIYVGGPNSNINGFDSNAIQMAVDLLKAHNGGVVMLEEGIYEILAPVRLSSNITLSGVGDKTVLHKVDGFKTKLAGDSDYGELIITVDDVTRFREGMGIMVYDSRYRNNWDVSTAIINRIEGKIIFFDQYLLRDYNTDNDGIVSNACSLIEGVEVHDVKVCGLSIEGNGNNNDVINGCIGGGIYLHKSRNCIIEDVKVRDFNGDGISWQIDCDVTIRGCEVSGCTGYGIHPGSGSLNTLVEKCDIHDNGSDGLFVCWRVQKSNFRNNKFHNNGRCGINIGHKDTDNLFEFNHIYENAFCGILMRKEKAANGAHRNVYSKNTIENNGNCEKGYGIYIDSFVEQISIIDNIIRDTGKNVQSMAIMINSEIKDANIEGNVP